MAKFEYGYRMHTLTAGDFLSLLLCEETFSSSESIFLFLVSLSSIEMTLGDVLADLCEDRQRFMTLNSTFKTWLMYDKEV